MIRLESIQLFSNLAPKEMTRVREAVQEITYTAGKEIFREGDSGDGLYIVKSGQVQISAVLNLGERVVLARIAPGEVFGEMAVLDENPRSATALAEEATEVFFISRENLLQLLEHIPRLSAYFVREISRRLREFNAQYVREVLQAERLSLVGRFASSIVHDLKNPLNIIGLSAEMAGAESATVETRFISQERIRKQVERISNMLNELLEFARGSQPTHAFVPMDFATFVENFFDDVVSEAELNSVTLEIPSLPPSVMVKINSARLCRVLHNLIRNSFDAIAGGKGTICVRFSQTPDEVKTEIEDSGPGIAEEMAGKLFQAFQTHGKANGTGLGLTICRRIIEDHGGKIYARSEPGRGAIFGFTLPIQHD